MLKTDILIIGAGAVGCAIARELTKYQAEVMVVDKNEDVGGDASKSNSAIIHTGFDATPGTLESELIVAANPMYDKLVEDLDVPFLRIGAILPAINKEQYENLSAIKEKAFKNRVYDIEYCTGKQLLTLEPNLNPKLMGGLHIPRESIIDPFLLVVALAENACENGASFLLNTTVTKIKRENNKVIGAITSAGEIKANYIINAAGLYCDEVAHMVGKKDYYVNPRKGQFYIMDKNTSCKVNHIVLPIPTKLTKGKLICPTIHGNILAGPTAEDLTDKCDKSTTFDGLKSIQTDVQNLIPNINFNDSITQYSGLRPNRNPEGLHIDVYNDVKNYINLSGVRSTGLTASIAIGKFVAQKLIDMGMPINFNPNFIQKRNGIIHFTRLSRKEQERLIKKNKLYGRVICRCETVTEGEIVDAINSTIPARSIDAIKRRVRPGTGRCQGGFCGPRIVDILSRELGVPPEKITKNESGSYMIAGKIR